MLRRAFAGLAALCVATAAYAAQPQFWKLEGARDFLDGDTEGLSIDSEGRVRLAPAARPVHDPEAPSVWSLARDGEGRLYAATGNDGKVIRIEGAGTSVTAYDAPELEVHALAMDGDDRLYAGSSPDGKVYLVDRGGRGQAFFDPEDKYIWALAVDREKRLLVATGSEGKVHRVDRSGKAEVILSGLEGHITALTVDAAGNVYAGSSPGGILYRIDTAGKVFVLHDSPFREVKALDVGRDGSLYAAVIDGRDRDETVRPLAPSLPAPSPAATAAPVGEVTVTESFVIAGPPSTPSPASSRPSESSRGSAIKGAVLRILPSGEIDTLWSSAEEIPHSLVAEDGGVLVGTGNKGQVYRVRDDRTWSMLASFPAEQVTSLLRTPAGAIHLATSNPGRVYTIEARPAPTGTFVSKVKDTETVSTWGRVRWEGLAPAGTRIEVMSRSGNTGTPDATWTAWSRPYARAEGEPLASESARFLQLKMVLTGGADATPILDTLTAAYLQRNLRPQIQSVTVHPPGEIFQKPISITGETEILGLDFPLPSDVRPSGSSSAPSRSGSSPATAYSRKMYQRGMQTFSWKADDPNEDSLAYDVEYRRIGDQRFRVLKKGLTEAVLAWDTSTVPNGRYLIRVTGSDAPSNPEALALAGDKESAPFDVDNTPPTVTVTLSGSPARVQATVRDDSSQVRKAEFSVDGGRWQEVHPRDGINDALDESYDIPLGTLSGPSPHIVVVRASDLLGNVSTGRVEIP
jgi:sugar lactone lactonase YvrE